MFFTVIAGLGTEAGKTSCTALKKRRADDGGTLPMATDEDTPTVTLNDTDDKDFLSQLSFEQVKELISQRKHLNVICQLHGQSVRRWRVCEVLADDSMKRFTVRLTEWPRVTIQVSPNRLHKHDSTIAV